MDFFKQDFISTLIRSIFQKNELISQMYLNDMLILYLKRNSRHKHTSMFP